MRYVTVEAFCSRRPEIVWDVLTDIAGLTTWVEGLRSATSDEKANETEDLASGSRLSLAFQGARELVRASCEVTICRPPAVLVLESRSEGALFLDRISLTKTADGTTILVQSEVAFGRPFSFAPRWGLLLGSDTDDDPLESIYERSVDALVKRIETMHATPYR